MLPPPPGIELAPGVHAPDTAVRIQTARSGGPGGQNVNKLNTKIELWLNLSQITGLSPRALSRLRHLAGRRLTLADELHLISESHRSQEANRAEAWQRLRQLLLQSLHEPKPRHKTRPTKASKRRRLESKRHRSELKSHRRSTPSD